MNWVQAFARQAESDLNAREILVLQAGLPACHALHHLQMACEKICKASMIASGTPPLTVQESHAYIAKQLPIIFRQYLNKSSGGKSRNNWIARAVPSLARKIELLSPSVRDGGRSPQNCEYPWLAADGISVVAPSDHRFDFSELFEPAGTTLLKVLRSACEDLQR